MAARESRRRAGVVSLGVAAVVLLGGCQIVSRVVMADPSPAAGTVATCVLLQVAPAEDGTDPTDTLAATGSVIQARLFATELRDVETTTVSPDRVIVGLPAGDDARWRAVVEATGDIQFVPVPPAFNQSVIDGRPLPDGLVPEPVFDGSGIASASVSEDQLGRPSVSLVMTPDAAAAFDAYAEAHYGERFAIVLDGIVVSSPSINATRFNGQAQISGDFSPESIKDLVAILTGGRLPTGVTEVAVASPVDGECSLQTFAP